MTPHEGSPSSLREGADTPPWCHSPQKDPLNPDSLMYSAAVAGSRRW